MKPETKRVNPIEGQPIRDFLQYMVDTFSDAGRVESDITQSVIRTVLGSLREMLNIDICLNKDQQTYVNMLLAEISADFDNNPPNSEEINPKYSRILEATNNVFHIISQMNLACVNCTTDNCPYSTADTIYPNDPKEDTPE